MGVRDGAFAIFVEKIENVLVVDFHVADCRSIGDVLLRLHEAEQLLEKQKWNVNKDPALEREKGR